jgi:hypothetical protein
VRDWRDDCDDPRLAERLRATMASDLLDKADDLKERQTCSAPHNKDVVTIAANLRSVTSAHLSHLGLQ